MTRFDDKTELFKPLSVCNTQAIPSAIGSIDQRWCGISLTGSFTERVNLDPNAATLVQLNQAVATLIKYLGGPR